MVAVGGAAGRGGGPSREGGRAEVRGAPPTTLPQPPRAAAARSPPWEIPSPPPPQSVRLPPPPRPQPPYRARVCWPRPLVVVLAGIQRGVLGGVTRGRDPAPADAGG